MEFENLRALLDQVLSVAAREKASDVYIKADCVPFLRIQGGMYPVECEPLMPQMTEHLAFTIMPAYQRERFERDHPEANFVYALEGVGRFRVNAYKQKGTVAMVLRRVEDEILEFNQLGLPEMPSSLWASCGTPAARTGTMRHRWCRSMRRARTAGCPQPARCRPRWA